MKFQKRGRLGTKIQMKCHHCRLDCLPKNGDWHDSPTGQIFLCRACEATGRAKRPALHPGSVLSAPLRA
jgi:hypothetical protein